MLVYRHQAHLSLVCRLPVATFSVHTHHARKDALDRSRLCRRGEGEVGRSRSHLGRFDPTRTKNKLTPLAGGQPLISLVLPGNRVINGLTGSTSTIVADNGIPSRMTTRDSIVQSKGGKSSCDLLHTMSLTSARIEPSTQRTGQTGFDSPLDLDLRPSALSDHLFWSEMRRHMA